ncbi:helix-turn-helix domain-containing protein [Phaeobacter inhibens]|uniref:helix-turn-helix domain-containing protein n=1 Tax=Phaeobacter inhibens TaxID=221822 RepID=UPI0021A650CC|nr:helix-turn-helix transcriptional regulator [Phaeobacter inhibens]
MYEYMEIADRLRDARLAAGFRSAAEAAASFGWTGSTYAAHENGTRGCKPADIKKYADAFQADPCFITFGTNTKNPVISGLSDGGLKEVITFVLSHEGAAAANPRDIADLVIDICDYVRQSGDGGLQNVVDFAFHRRAARSV